MATSARRGQDLLVDTSVAVALTVADHEHHDDMFDALEGRHLGLAGVERLPSMGIAGGSVYDALVGATAAEHGLRLVSCDRRALETYRALDVEVEFLS